MDLAQLYEMKNMKGTEREPVKNRGIKRNEQLEKDKERVTKRGKL